jgi:membrane-associated phospholipid phosphatase
MIDLIADADREVLHAVRSIAHEPVTSIAIVLSAWWVKGPLMVALALFGDLRWGRRRLPVAAMATTIAALLGSWLCSLLKELFDRARPSASGDWTALIDTPSSASFPSGHAMGAFSAATAIAILRPELRWIALALAALVAASRVVLGVHYPLDVTAGAIAGSAVGALVALAARQTTSARVR